MQPPHPPVSPAPLRRAVFLDRDGVLNRALMRDGKPNAPARLEDLEILPGVPEALARLKAAGFMLVVVTNQPDVVRGTVSRETVETLNAQLAGALPLDEIRVCFHDDADQCRCRKPKPGLLLDAAREHALDLKRSFMVGDRWRDIEAGRRAGCKTIHIDYGYQERQPEAVDLRVHSLAEAVDYMLQPGVSA